MEKLVEDMKIMKNALAEMKSMKDDLAALSELVKGLQPKQLRLKDDSDSSHNMTGQPGFVDHSPFKVEARIEIPAYNGDLSPEELDGWLKSLEVYFSTKGFSKEQRVSFARLRLDGHALIWWEAYTSGLDAPVTTWKQFTTAIQNQLYPIGYKERLRE